MSHLWQIRPPTTAPGRRLEIANFIGFIKFYWINAQLPYDSSEASHLPEL